MQPSLDRFLLAQETHYESALRELKSGAKFGHWMWYIFPQLRGLGQSETSWHFGIIDAKEAMQYLNHPILGARLLESTRAVLAIQHPVLKRIFPPPDDLKFASCMTLFALQPLAPPQFQNAINVLLEGKMDSKTIALLDQSSTS